MKLLTNAQRQQLLRNGQASRERDPLARELMPGTRVRVTVLSEGVQKQVEIGAAAFRVTLR
jgi:hypothetical protein